MRSIASSATAMPKPIPTVVAAVMLTAAPDFTALTIARAIADDADALVEPEPAPPESCAPRMLRP